MAPTLDIDSPEAAEIFFAAVQGGPGAEKMSAAYRQWKKDRASNNSSDKPNTTSQQAQPAPRGKTKVNNKTLVAPRLKTTRTSNNQPLSVRHAAVARSPASDTRADAGTVCRHDSQSMNNNNNPSELPGNERTRLYAPSLVAASRQPRPNNSYNDPVRNDQSCSLSSIGSEYEEEVNRMHFQGTLETMMGTDQNKQSKQSKGGWDNVDSCWQPDQMPTYIPKWRLRVPTLATAFLQDQVPGHWLRDVDTYTGALLDPIDYPETIPSVVSEKGGLDYRRRTWTSGLLMRRRAEFDHGNGRIDAPAVHHMVDVPDRHDHDDREEMSEEQREILRQEVQELRRERARNPPPDPLTPRLPAYLRPAQLCDMAQVAGIYNREVSEGIQARDSEPLSKADFERIFQQTSEQEMPFLVAVYGSVRQRGRKQMENDILTTCVRHPAAKARLDPSLIGTVLGFVFLSVWEPGLAGGLNGSSRATARVHVFVHPDHRRKRLGTSLLDKVISTLDSSHFSTNAYDFVDDAVTPLYRMHTTNTMPGVFDTDRRYHKLFLSVFVKTVLGGDPANPTEEEKHYEDDLYVVEPLVTDQFQFEKKGRFVMVHRTPRSRPGPVFWLDEVVFERNCSWGQDPFENERY